MSKTLASYMRFDGGDRPAWLIDHWRALHAFAGPKAPEEDISSVLNTFERSVDAWIADGSLTGDCSAEVMFTAKAMRLAYEIEGRPVFSEVLGYVFQLTLSEDQWSEFLKAYHKETGTRQDEQGKLPDLLQLEHLPFHVMSRFFELGRVEFLRALFREVHFEVDSIARRAMRDAKTFDEWHGHLLLLAAHFSLRRLMPLTIPADSESEQRAGQIRLTADVDGNFTGAHFVAPSQIDNPWLKHLFNSEEVQQLKRKEAYASECFAHLFTSLAMERISEEGQEKQKAELQERSEVSRLDAREWLARSKAKFEAAPYLT